MGDDHTEEVAEDPLAAVRLTPHLHHLRWIGPEGRERARVNQTARGAVRGALVAQPIELEGGLAVRISASVGGVVADGQAPPGEVLAAADRAMYAHKRTGRDTPPPELSVAVVVTKSTRP